MTLQGALRFDHAWSYSPEQIVGPTSFLPTPIVFPETAGVIGYNDLSPRGRPGLRRLRQRQDVAQDQSRPVPDAASNNNGNYSITNPTSRMAGSTSRLGGDRSWTDNGNYIPTAI